MQATAIFVIILCSVTIKSSLHLSRNTKDAWKSRNRRQLKRTLRLRDTESRIYYLPRTFKDKVAFNKSNSPSFEDVVSQLKEMGILDLPTVSVIPASKYHQLQKANISSAFLAFAKSRKKRCAYDNPCGGCPSANSEYFQHLLEEVALLKVKKVQCSNVVCMNGNGICTIINRRFEMYAKSGSQWSDATTLTIPVTCACVSASSG